MTALLASSLLYADWINLTGAETAANVAEIRIGDDAVDVSLEIYINDIATLLSDGVPTLSVSADGIDLAPQVLLSEPRTRVDRLSPFAGMIDPRTRRIIPGPPKDTRVQFVRIRYPFNGRPKALNFKPPTKENGAIAATIGFIAYHKAAPINDFRYLSQAESLLLDWEDPWFSGFENRNLTRHHRWPQMSFVYIEPREVRHEILVRVRDLAEWTDLAVTNPGKLTADDKAAIKQAAGDFFKTRNPLSIDGKVTSPSTWRNEFLAISPAGLTVLEEDAKIDPSAAILGISLSFWTKALPTTVTIDWELFDERVNRVPTNVTDPAGPYPSFVTPKYPFIEWTNYLKNYKDPVVEPVRVSSDSWLDWEYLRFKLLGVPGNQEAGRIVRELLQNSAVALLVQQPKARDDALALIVTDDQLGELSRSLEQIFAIPTRGGGVARIEAQSQLQLEQLSPLGQGEGFRVLASWQARAIGQHWGHVDRRELRFRALIDINKVQKKWKLAGLTVIESQFLTP